VKIQVMYSTVHISSEICVNISLVGCWISHSLSLSLMHVFVYMCTCVYVYTLFCALVGYVITKGHINWLISVEFRGKKKQGEMDLLN
jgi:hypothetical protein